VCAGTKRAGLTRLGAAVRLNFSRVEAKTLRVASIFRAIVACGACVAIAGCPSRNVQMAKAPSNASLQTASKSDLIAKYNQRAESINSINAGVSMQFTGGSAYTGVATKYPHVNGFILAQKPEMVRVIGQAPVVSTKIFDMVSDGKTFSVYVPSKQEFLTGPTNATGHSEKATENLRPQHLLEAIFWRAIPASEPVLFEQAMDNGKGDSGTGDYVLTVITRAESAADWRITRKIWFERAGLTMARIQIFGDKGELESDIRYAGWSPFGDVQYPKQIQVDRPNDGYQLTITVTKLTPNETLQANSFVLPQPEGAKLIHVGAQTGSTQN
jgi:outer membrane lipoprotein-sorting protein